jgi:hypothetical protein
LLTSFVFERRDFAQPAQMPFSLTVLGHEKRLDQVPSYFRTNRPSAHAQDIHVIVLHTLLCGKVIMYQGSASPSHLIGADRSPYSTATNGNPSIDLTRNNGMS